MRKLAETVKASAGRVLILLENEPVPFDIRVWQEATALTEAGYKVSVICPKGRDSYIQSYEVLDHISIYRFRPREAKSGLIRYLIEYANAIVKMMLLCAIVYLKEGFDVIQLCNPPDLLFLVAWPYRLLGKRVIFDHHDLCPELYLTKTNGKGMRFVHRVLLLLERLTFKTCDIVISTNESYKRIAVSRGEVPESRVFIVRNGPDLNRIRVVEPNSALKKGKRYLIFYVGVMENQDGVDYLLRSIHYLLHVCKRDDFQVLLMGGGTELDRLKDYARELRIKDVVTFTGRVPDHALVEALSTADICVCPDPKNPLNNVSTMIKTLEFMALRKPIVAYDLLETRVSAGNAALYATPNDEKDFGDKIATLLDSPELRIKLGKIGQERICNDLSWDCSKKHLYAAYKLAFKNIRVE